MGNATALRGRTILENVLNAKVAVLVEAERRGLTQDLIDEWFGLSGCAMFNQSLNNTATEAVPRHIAIRPSMLRLLR